MGLAKSFPHRLLAVKFGGVFRQVWVREAEAPCGVWVCVCVIAVMGAGDPVCIGLFFLCLELEHAALRAGGGEGKVGDHQDKLGTRAKPEPPASQSLPISKPPT